MTESLIAITEGTGKNVSTQQVTINGQTVEIERSMMGVGVVSLPESPDVETKDAAFLSDAIDLQGRYYIILKSTFSLSTNSAVIRLLFIDAADVEIGYTDNITVDNTGKDAGGSRYFGLPVVYGNVFSAKSFKISLESISAGNISIFAGVA
jgi:hypothetical protein